MGAFDEDIIGAAQSIRESGELATLVRFTTTTPDPAKPWESGDPVREEQPDVPMVFLNFNSQSSGQTYWNGSLVETGDKKVLVAAQRLTWDPALQGQVIRADGSVWKIENVKLLDPNGQKILFTLQVRQ